jgi:hypothetical protein
VNRGVGGKIGIGINWLGVKIGIDWARCCATYHNPPWNLIIDTNILAKGKPAITRQKCCIKVLTVFSLDVIILFNEEKRWDLAVRLT